MLGAVGAGLCEQDPILQLYSSSRFFTDSSRPRQRVQDCPHFTKERTEKEFIEYLYNILDNRRKEMENLMLHVKATSKNEEK